MKFIGDFDGTLEDYITTLPAVTSIGTGQLSITASEVYLYDATNDGNPTISLGSTANERFEIKAQYESGAQGMDVVKFTTYTAGGSANDGRYSFFVDEVSILQIKDDVLNLSQSMNLSIGGVDILADSSGTTTLSNIDALDATTEATIESAIDTLSNLTTVGATGVNTLVSSDDVQFYNPVNGGHPSYSFGASATERLMIQPVYDTGAQTLDYVQFKTFAASGTANKGTVKFLIDESPILNIDDGGIDFAANMGVSINGTDVITDSSGTATLSNIDALDATTESTIEAAIDTLSNLTTVGTIGTGVWNGTKITPVYTNASGIRYGSTIKILPSDFMINDDAASPLSFKDGSNSGVHVNDTANEAIAFIAIPEGMKATALDIYATHTRAISVYEVDLNASFDFTATADETGNCNTQVTIDPNINATATNYLAIIIALNNSVHRIHGGVLTIANQ